MERLQYSNAKPTNAVLPRRGYIPTSWQLAGRAPFAFGRCNTGLKIIAQIGKRMLLVFSSVICIKYLVLLVENSYLCQLSKLMLFPNLAYKSTFKASISSRMVLSLLSIVETDSSILTVDELSISCTSGNGNDINVSPILYLGLHQ